MFYPNPPEVQAARAAAMPENIAVPEVWLV
jgi:hypothetical protein